MNSDSTILLPNYIEKNINLIDEDKQLLNQIILNDDLFTNEKYKELVDKYNKDLSEQHTKLEIEYNQRLNKKIDDEKKQIETFIEDITKI